MTRPDTPINLMQTGATATTITFSWDASEGATSYSYQYPGIDPVDLGDVTEATATGLDASTAYEFQILARNEAGDSDWSEPVLMETTGAPGEPASGTVTTERLNSHRPKAVKLFKTSWTSDGDGNAVGEVPGVNGAIARRVIEPGSGDAQPSASYNITLLDIAGVDVLMDTGANLSNANPSSTCPLDNNGAPVAVSGPLTLNVSGAGEFNGGILYLWVR